MKGSSRQPIARTGTDHDRGLSEVVAFTLVFAIILTSVALLFTTGFGALDDLQENEQLNNAERGMTALADNFNDVLRHDGVDERFGELALGDGTVITESDGGTVIENITHDEDEIFTDQDHHDLDLESDELDLGEFAYQAHSQTIAYEGGGVVRSADDGGSVMIAQPRLRCNPDSGAVTISLANINAPTQSFQSSETTGFRMSVEDREKAIETEDDGETVEINLSTDYETAWDGSGRGDWEWTEDGGIHTATCDDIDRVVVHIVTVDIEIEN